MTTAVDVVIVGAGPAGSAAAGLLASWGHRVVMLSRAADPARGHAESIPPSTRKLLAAVGALDAIDRAGFYRSTGNTVWWASSEPRIERFGDVTGYQVFRPEFDRVLVESARASGADVHDDARVRAVAVDEGGARVEYEEAGRPFEIGCRFAIDCSGRTGVVARRVRRAQPGHRTTALIGVWRRPGGWPLPDPTHTTVETFDEGWIWSVPIAPEVRHVAVMVETIATPAPIEEIYRDAVRRSRALGAWVDEATLDRLFACDASLYRSTEYAFGSCLLAGDAGSFIDPLSSYGVKKALGSAWVAAIAAHTALVDPARRAVAFEFFSERERQVYDDYLRRSRDFARDAVTAHPGAFWRARANVDIAERRDDAVDPGQIHATFERLKAADDVEFAMAGDVDIEPRPIIRGREIVVEPSFAGLRFHEHIDLVALANVACRSRSVPDACEAYAAAHGAAPLPSVLGALSLLVARGILTMRAARLEDVRR